MNTPGNYHAIQGREVRGLQQQIERCNLCPCTCICNSLFNEPDGLTYISQLTGCAPPTLVSEELNAMRLETRTSVEAALTGTSGTVDDVNEELLVTPVHALKVVGLVYCVVIRMGEFRV